MTPTSEADRYCVWWLQDYFQTVGDSSPNDSEISLNMGTIKNQYKMYYLTKASDDNSSPSSLSAITTELSKENAVDLHESFDSEETSSSLFNANIGSNIVSYQRFCELWRTLFPKAVNRPYRSIMGKCKTCQEIDEGKKKSDATTVILYICLF